MDQDLNILETIIIGLLRKAGGHGLSKTQLIKLVFLLDIEAVRRNGSCISGCRYHTDQFGVVDYNIWDAAMALADEEHIKFSADHNEFGSPIYRIFLVEDIFESPLPDVQAAVDIVWEKYGELNAAKLGGITKEFVPMDDEWETGVLVDPRDIVYENSKGFQNHANRVLGNYPEDHSEIRPIEEIIG